MAGVQAKPGNYTGNGGPATLAQLNAPLGVALDSRGNIYIADYSNNVVRKVNITTGIITTVAGQGPKQAQAGVNGIGGLATSAQLYQPIGLYIDSSDNIYIADGGGEQVKKIDHATKILSLIAGSPQGTLGNAGDGFLATGTNVQFHFPAAVQFTPNGDLYILDIGASIVRKVDHLTGIISTVYGNNRTQGYSGDGFVVTHTTDFVSTKFNVPRDMKFDASYNLYIADSSNNAIRRIDHATLIVTTVAGTGVAGSTGDGGLATAAKLNSPRGIAFDSSGNYYITEYSGHRVRKVDIVTGIISTVAGTGVSGYSGDGGFATNAKLNKPNGIVVHPSGYLIVAENGNNVIRKISFA